MPDHDLFDLDDAFASLERDIATISSPRGAGQAVATARRRRRTTIGAVSAVAVLAVGAVAIGQGLGGHDHAVSPTDGLPDPRPLDASSLTAATAGWLPYPWVKPSDASLSLLSDVPTPCLDRVAGGISPNPVRAGHTVLTDQLPGPGPAGSSPSQAIAIGGVADFGTDDAAAQRVWTALTAGAAACTDATQTDDFTLGAAAGTRYTITPASSASPQYLWLVRVHDEMGIVWIGNVQDPMPSSTGDKVTLALLAGVQSPDSYTATPDTSGGGFSTSSGSTSSSGSPSYGSLGSATFEQALQGWRSGWSPDGGSKETSSLPCGASATGSYGVGSNLGANGDQEYFGYGTTASAVSDVQAIGLKLAACTSASYDVHNVTLSDGHVVSVAAATGDQGAVVWMAQQGPIVMYVVVPAGQTPPPDSVSRAVGGLLYGLIDHPQASSGNGTPVQSETPATKVVKQHATARSSSN